MFTIVIASIEDTAIATRRERLRAATQDEVKEIARRQIAAHGAAALSLRAVAREMGVTAPALYRYFASRDDLVTSLIIDSYHSLAAALESASETHSTDGWTARLVAVLLTYRMWALEHAEDYLLILSTRVPGYEEPTMPVAMAAGRSMQLLMALFEAAQQAGVWHPPAEFIDPAEPLRRQLDEWSSRHGYRRLALHLALSIWSHLHGLVSLELCAHLQPIIGDPEQLYRAEVVGLLSRMGLDIQEPHTLAEN